MTRSLRRGLSGWLVAVAATLVFACGAAADTGADGHWRLILDLSSFHDGHIATFDEIIEVRDGQFDGGFRKGGASVALTFWIAGNAVRGNMAVDAGPRWNWVTIKYDGPVVDGVFSRELVGPATYDAFGFKHRDHISRNVDVVMRLERR